MILNKQDALYAATKLMKYFEDFNRIDDYFRSRKIDRVKDIPIPLPGMGLEDDLFQEFDMHPEDMDFSIVQVTNEIYNTLLEMTASFSQMKVQARLLSMLSKKLTQTRLWGLFVLALH